MPGNPWAALRYGVAHNHIVDRIEDGVDVPLDIALFTERIATFVTAEDVPFLQGRALVTGMSFTKILPDDVCVSLLDASVLALESHATQPVPVLISAMESINELCTLLGDERKDLLLPRLESMMGILIELGPKVSPKIQPDRTCGYNKT